MVGVRGLEPLCLINLNYFSISFESYYFLVSLCPFLWHLRNDPIQQHKMYNAIVTGLVGRGL